MEKKFACFWQRFDAVTETLKISVVDDLRCFNAFVDCCLVVFLFWILVFIVEMEDLYIFTLPGESMCYYVVFKIFACAVLLKG